MLIFITAINVLFATGVAATILLYMRRKLNFITKTVSESANTISETVWTTRTIDAHVNAKTSLPRPNDWTLDAAAISTLCQILERQKPSVIVELGSGLSTPIIAVKIKEYGGKLISVDHDREFAEATESFVAANGLQGVVDIRVAELRETDKESASFWYDQSAISDISNIDLLLIDGPPKPVDPMIRRHALPFFLDKLSPNATVMLDDANRIGERKIIDQWFTDYPLKNLQVRGFPKSHAVMTLANDRAME